MASSLLRSISDFLEFGMDDCINQLYDSTLLESDQELQNKVKRHSRGNEIRSECNGYKYIIGHFYQCHQHQVK